MPKALVIKPASLPICIRKGSTLDHIFTWKAKDPETGEKTPIDLTGYTARMQIRSAATAPNPPILSLTTENGGLELGGEHGTIRVIITAETTAGFTFANAVYDLELVSSSGHVTGLLAGPFEATDEVTRE